MLNVCKTFAKDYIIPFNALKNLVMYFVIDIFNSNNILYVMSNGSIIQFVQRCVHLGTTKCSVISIIKNR